MQKHVHIDLRIEEFFMFARIQSMQRMVDALYDRPYLPLTHGLWVEHGCDVHK